MNPIYVALDMTDAYQALCMADAVRDHVGGLKIGLALWVANGPEVILRIVEGFDWFLDLKWKDIPVQVAGAVRAVVPMQPTFLSIHEDGGALMMEAAVKAAREAAALLQLSPPKILAVTTLTSLPSTPAQVCAQAQRAMACGLDGMISSPYELRYLRSEVGTKPILMTPGIRMIDGASDDHLRIATPKEAITAGANYIVVGRPITMAANPRDAAKAVHDSLG